MSTVSTWMGDRLGPRRSPRVVLYFSKVNMYGCGRGVAGGGGEVIQREEGEANLNFSIVNFSAHSEALQQHNNLLHKRKTTSGFKYLKPLVVLNTI